MTVRQEKDYDDIDTKNGLYYTDERFYPDSKYIHTCLYDDTGHIKGYSITFYSMTVGKVYAYDVYGKVADEEDMDAPYKFSLENLILKMKKKYGIDIEKGDNVHDFNRFTADNGSFYVVSVTLNESMRDIYLIDGNNGKTLFKSREQIEWYPGMDEESIYEKYLKSK
ncbi:hypothetical protein [uncultured Bacteroides sp.]|uniref:hypothetical protein n=1 Tax=uncultured Bacteroides sp. TaxID=162156 RepID=UPI0026212AD8|nr:hypothetical protein [uncultured Bacteroides sp.]